MSDRFEPNDLIFAKVRGIAWPAQVTRRLKGENEVYEVQFYGTYQRATVKPDCMFTYDKTSKAKYGKYKISNRWEEAMDEIDYDHYHADPGAYYEEVPAEPVEPEGDANGEHVTNTGPQASDSSNDIENVEPEAEQQQPRIRRCTKCNVILTRENCMTFDTPAPEVNDTPTAADITVGRTTATKRSADEISKPTESENFGEVCSVEVPSTKQIRQPVTSRSRMLVGKRDNRKVSQMRSRVFLDLASAFERHCALEPADQDNPAHSQTDNKPLAACEAGTSASPSSVSETENKPEVNEISNHSLESNDETIMRFPFSDKVEVKFEMRMEIKDILESEGEKTNIATEDESIVKMRDEYEENEEEMQENQEILSLSSEECSSFEVSVHPLIVVETDLVLATHEIMCCLSMSVDADPLRAYQLMEKFKTSEISKLMLLKNPEIVQTFAKIRNYVGNVKNWGMTDQEAEEFEERAAKVKESAKEILSIFSDILISPEEQSAGVCLENDFSEMVKIFKEKTKDIPKPDLIRIIAENDDGTFVLCPEPDESDPAWYQNSAA